MPMRRGLRYGGVAGLPPDDVPNRRSAGVWQRMAAKLQLSFCTAKCMIKYISATPIPIDTKSRTNGSIPFRGLGTDRSSFLASALINIEVLQYLMISKIL